MPSWYAVWTRARHEQRVCEQLAARQVNAFLPTQLRISQWKDRRKCIAWPLFPGYCFVRIEAEDVHLVTRCQGVASVLSIGGRLAPIPDEEIDALARLMRTELRFDTCIPHKPGTRVRVVRGPLAGVYGTLLREPHDAQLLLAVELLNNAARLSISMADVEPAPLQPVPVLARTSFVRGGGVLCPAR